MSIDEESFARLVAEAVRSVPAAEFVRWADKIADDWAHSRDVPWWYNERASLSVFARAVWASGEVAFEEFFEEKRTVSRRTHKFRGPYSGIGADGSRYHAARLSLPFLLFRQIGRGDCGFAAPCQSRAGLRLQGDGASAPVGDRPWPCHRENCPRRHVKRAGCRVRPCSTRRDLQQGGITRRRA